MNHHPIRKSLVATATALSFVLLLAAPASSAPTITGGTLDIGNPPLFSFPLGEDAEDPPCKGTLKPPLGEFDFDVEGDESSGTWEASGGFAGVFSITVLTTTWYQVNFDFSGLSGSYVKATPPPNDRWNLTGGGQIEVDVWIVTPPDPPNPDEDCEKTSVDPVCTITVTVQMVPPSHYQGPWLPANPGVLTVNANSVAPHLNTAGCPFPLSLMNGQPAFLNNMTIAL